MSKIAFDNCILSHGYIICNVRTEISSQITRLLSSTLIPSVINFRQGVPALLHPLIPTLQKREMREGGGGREGGREGIHVNE